MIAPSCRIRRSFAAAFTLVELLFAIGILAILMAFLLPMVSTAHRNAMQARLNSSQEPILIQTVSNPSVPPLPAEATLPAARVTSFDGQINLVPRLSIGTADPESIYKAGFTASITAIHAPDAGSNESRLELPLPPQVVSVADLSFSIDGVPSQSVTSHDGKLIWHGKLPTTAPAKVEVSYTAVGRGLYVLELPEQSILDRFKMSMTAHGSDVRMLNLSMQPTAFDHTAEQTSYTWDYNRLMFGRPIALDVLGIAPIDRLGELRWLAPLSVIAFGLVLGIIAKAFPVADFDRWMLLLVLGLFAGAYPLMYFGQLFIPLRLATNLVGGVVVLLITIRAVSLMGFRVGVLGVTVPASAIMALTLAAALRTNLQGLLITILSLALFALGMLLAPRMRLLRMNDLKTAAIAATPAPTPAPAL